MPQMLPRTISLREITGDSASVGSLSVLQSNVELGFPIRRVYFIYGMEQGTERGGHAHKEMHQCLIMVHGSARIMLEGPGGKYEFVLQSPTQGLIVPPDHWREMRDFSKDAVLLALASTDYDPSDYIRDYTEFKRWSAERAKVSYVPYIDFTRRYASLRLELEQAAAAVMAESRYIMGPRLQAFENEFAAFCGATDCIGTGNGLDALELILRGMDIGAGDEVIMSAGGFIATPLAVLAAGAVPVFVECLPWGNIDSARIERAVTAKSKAILLTHLYGLPADMDSIHAVARKYSLKIIEDACQAHGSRYKGRLCGSLGDAAAFSFYPTKNLGGFGDGGCVVTKDAGLAAVIRKLRNYGSSVKYHHDLVGKNSRLDEMQAALLSVLLPHLEGWNACRRGLAGIYHAELGSEQGVILPEAGADMLPNWHVFPLRVRNGRRDELADWLQERRIGVNIHYPVPMHLQKCLSHLALGPGTFPVAEALAAEELSLPLDAFTTEAEARQAARAVREFFRP